MAPEETGSISRERLNQRRVPQNSRVPSEESDSVVSNAGRRFQKTRIKITTELNSLQTAENVHTEVLKERVKMVKEDLKALRVNDILDKFPYEPQMDEVYGYTADNIEDWADLCEGRIRKIQILAEQQISERKAATTNDC